MTATATPSSNTSGCNCKAIKFDTYRLDGDDNYKKMIVYADDTKIHEDADYMEQGKVGEWTSHSYDIPEAAANAPVLKAPGTGDTVKLRMGINSNKPNYMIDNVRLTPRDKTSTVIEDINVEAEAAAEYFNLQGIRVNAPAAGQIYIVRRGNTVSKVRF